MPEFRCDVVDNDGNFLFPADIVAEHLSIAIQHAFDNLCRYNTVAATEHAYAFELWTDPTDTGKEFSEALQRPVAPNHVGIAVGADLS
jgi:hypothetical protein